jgi:FKBP-type peptidyl-prolyl cis-trans isomerase 2
MGERAGGEMSRRMREMPLPAPKCFYALIFEYSAMDKGDFIKVSYTGFSEGELIETTEEAVAKKHGAHDKGRKYKPANIVVGEGMVLPGIDKAFEGMKVSERKELKLSAKDAFGERNFKLIQLVPLRDFHKQKINPIPGMVFEVEGRPAKVQSIGSGRVRVDFNHPLAGKPVEYEIKIEASAKTEAEKIEYLLERAFKEASIKYEASGEGEKRKITVEVTDNVKANRLYQIMRAVFKVEAEKYLGVKDVEFKEPEKKAAAEKEAAKKE